MTNESTKELMNFRIPLTLKDKFHKKCNENYTSMSHELIQLIRGYISDSTK